MSSHVYGRILQTLKSGDLPEGITCQMRVSPNADSPHLQGDVPRGLYLKFSDGTEILIGGGDGTNVKIINTTYNDLTDIVNNSELVAGNVYKIDIQTKQVISGTTAIHTGTTETIYLTASSVNTFSGNVVSEQFPFDTIHYDFFSSFCENGTTPRTGKITFRRDTNNNEAPFDTRNIVRRNFLFDISLYTPWATATNYNSGQQRLEAGVLYRCRVTHVSGVFADDLADFLWEDISAINGKEYWLANGNFLGDVSHNDGTFTDVPVFVNTFNTKVGYISNVNDPYGNVGFTNCTYVTVQDNCKNLRITSGLNFNIGEQSEDLCVTTAFYCTTDRRLSSCYLNFVNSRIGHINSMHFIVGSTVDLGLANSYHNLNGVSISTGVQNSKLLISDASTVKTFDYVSSIVIQADAIVNIVKDVSIGYNSQNIKIYNTKLTSAKFGSNCGITTGNILITGATVNSTGNLVVGNGCDNISILKDFNNISIGNNSFGISVNTDTTSLSIGDECSDLSFNGILIRNVSIGGTCVGYSFMSGSSVSDTTFGKGCQEITINVDSVVDGCVFSNLVSVINLATTMSLAACEFIGLTTIDFNQSQIGLRILAPLGINGIPTVVNNAHDYAVVDAMSLDGSGWYNITTDLGVTTRAKLD